MAVPSSLVQSASDIVDKSLSSGARGSQTTVTDYSTLSDAFMRKAELDANIANMYMDSTNQRAGMMADLEINKANLMLKGEELKLNAMIAERQFEEAEKANTLSPFEQITGVLAGAASGAAAGKTFGPKGAMIGGIAGGAMALGAGKDRRAQSTVLGNIGMISTAAIQFKELGDQQKAKDQNKSWSDGLDSLVNARNALASDGKGPGTPEYEAASMKIENHIQGLDKIMQEQNVPIQERAETMGAYKKHVLGYDPDDESFKYAKEMKDHVFEARNSAALKDPTHENHIAERDNFYAKLDRTHRNYHGEGLDRGGFGSYLEDVNPGLAQKVFKGKASSGGSSSGLATGHNSQTSLTGSDPGVTSITGAGQRQSKTATAQSGLQGGQQGAPVPHTGTVRTGQNFGVTYDRQAQQDPVEEAFATTKQGAETAKVLNQDRQKAGMSESGATGTWDDTADGDDMLIEVEDKRKPVHKRMTQFFKKGAEATVDALGGVFYDTDTNTTEEKKIFVKELTNQNKQADSEAINYKETLMSSPDKDTQTFLKDADDALAGIDRQIEMIKNKEVKTFNSPSAEIGDKWRKDGIKEGGKVIEGKNVTIGMDNIERAKWDEMNAISKKNSRVIGKTYNKGTLGEADVEDFRGNGPSPGKTPEQAVAGLVAQKKMIVNKMKAMAESEGSPAAARARADADTTRLKDQTTIQKNLLDIQSKSNKLENDEWVPYGRSNL